MKYRTDNKSGNELSILGFGCMRFPRTLGQIDIVKTEKLITEAVKNGINYFDTAYIYGGSEEALGTILHKNNLRDKVFIATKLPLQKCKRYEDFDSLFATQLERLKTDCIDYYFMHMLSDTKLWNHLCGIGIEKWIAAKKAEGKIKQVGFSFHGKHNEFMSLLDVYEWDFCQIQYNYVNINYQAGEAGLKKAASMGIPVMIMEPLLGGKLADGLPQKAVDLFRKINHDISPAAWALRWLWNQSEVTVVLSGMNDDSQLKENLDTAGNSLPNMFTQEELDVFEPVIQVFRSSYKIPCTGCNYCMPCPQNVNIPACFAAYNISCTMGKVTGMMQYMTSIGVSNMNNRNWSGASKCVGCGKCEKHCPQNIQISTELTKASRKMEPFLLKAIIKLFSKRG